MNKELRQRLEAKRDELINEAGERLLTDAEADIGKIVGHVETYSKLLAASKPPPSRERVWAVVVVVLCLSSAGLLWSLPVSSTRITLNLQSDAIELKLADIWSWSGDLQLDTNLMVFEALSTIEGLLLGSSIESSNSNAWITVEGGQASLKKLGMNQHGVLRIERTGGGQIDFFLRAAKFRGQFIVLGSMYLSVGKEIGTASYEKHLEELTIPESIAFGANGDSVVPTRFKVRPHEPWVLWDLRVQDLRFSRETPAEPGAVAFVPSILQGTLTLLDVSETVALRAKDRLTLTGVEGRVVELTAKDGINLIFEGIAKKVQVGPKGFERNLAPTYLAYIYHQRQLAFFWGAVVFLWGVLWGVRRMIFA